ncbi:MAG: type II toxin-antitoxin system RelE/ParE family toxin [Bacillota bacterium]
MQNKFIAEFTEIAKGDLSKILDYIEFELMNPKAASDFAEDVFNGINRACENPLMYQVASNELIMAKDVRRFIVSNYKVFYQTIDNRLIILRIVYSKRDMQGLLS